MPKSHDVHRGIARLSPALDVLDRLDVPTLSDANLVSVISRFRRVLGKPNGKPDLLRAWPILTYAASHQQLLTHELLGKLTEMHAPGLGAVLEHIQSYCPVNKVPPLSAIVVNKGTGLPSRGFVAATNVPRVFRDVFEHDWLATRCPLPDELSEARELRQSNGIVEAASVTPPTT